MINPVPGSAIAPENNEVNRLGYLPDEEIESKRREENLANAVMNYLSEHPRAMDDLRGIAEWWVTRQQVRVDVEALVRVLERLVMDGHLERVVSVNGPYYRLSRQSSDGT